MTALHQYALTFPEAQEGEACDKRAYKARKKSFLFLGGGDDSFTMMVKLSQSLDEVAELARREPARYEIGHHGWVTATFPRDTPPSQEMLERWVDESYRLVAPKALVARLG